MCVHVDEVPGAGTVEGADPELGGVGVFSWERGNVLETTEVTVQRRGHA